VAVDVVCTGKVLQVYVKGATPAAVVTVADPSLNPWQVAFTTDVFSITPIVCTFTLSTEVHFAASVTVNVNTELPREVGVCMGVAQVAQLNVPEGDQA
jgi:hypothetical protein